MELPFNAVHFVLDVTQLFRQRINLLLNDVNNVVLYGMDVAKEGIP